MSEYDPRYLACGSKTYYLFDKTYQSCHIKNFYDSVIISELHIHFTLFPDQPIFMHYFPYHSNLYFADIDSSLYHDHSILTKYFRDESNLFHGYIHYSLFHDNSNTIDYSLDYPNLFCNCKLSMLLYSP